MKRFLSFFTLFVLAFSFIPAHARAAGCYADPVLEYSGSGMIKSAVYIRSEACVSGTLVLKTISAGANVPVVAYTDGWYEVVYGGKRGWIGQQFLNNNAQPTGMQWNTYPEYRSSPQSEGLPAPVPVAPVLEEAYTGDIATRDLIKLVCLSTADANDPCRAVYYLGADGARHAFPNSRVFFTWYANFDAVHAVTAERLGQYPLGVNITYRPGVRMVKFTTDPKVYAIADGGVLRWVASEELARTLYDQNWNTKIDDIPDAFYTNYTFGADVASSTDFDLTAEADGAPTFD